MMEEYAIFGDYQRAIEYIQQQQARPIRQYIDADEDDGFPTPIKCYDEPNTLIEFEHLEKYGYFYK